VRAIDAFDIGMLAAAVEASSARVAPSPNALDRAPTFTG
jgi:hypothetical protein